jgi:ankyrin repeat protein
MHGHLECVDYLLKKNLFVNQKSKFGWTPLHIAAKQNQIKVAQLLL